MTLPQLIHAIQESAVGEWMRYTPRAMPLIEATHVLAAVAVFGSVLVMDLRLLGVAHAKRTFTRVAHDMLPITWGAFCLAAITGSLMFTTAAETYFANTSFRVKMLALLTAGLNMAFFQFVTRRGVAGWDAGRPPGAARVAGLVSVVLWAAMVLLGRWIGFTKGYDFTIPAGTKLDFSH
jgi:hypothetical protein